MQKESGYLNPYETVVDDQGRYWFLTESNICYHAYFTDSFGYFQFYPQFDQKVVTSTFKPYDPESGKLILKTGAIQSANSTNTRIRDTVIWLLLESFRLHPQKSVIIICESSDRLALSRMRLFDRWFRKASELVPHCISKYDSDFGGEGYGSIFIHNFDPHHDLIRDAFVNISGSDK